MACAQNATSREVSVIDSPTFDLNHWRSESIKLTTAMGVPQILAANSANWSYERSGALSRTPLARNACTRSCSFAGTGAFTQRFLTDNSDRL
jgi:hypothetical protein